MTWSSGQPLTILAGNSELTWTPVPGQIAIVRTMNTPMILGDFPKSTGKITTDAGGATYFAGFTQIDDPFKSNITPNFPTTSAQNLQNSFSNKVLKDANGNIVLANPAPGTVGTLGRTWIEGPSHIKLDMNLVKRIRIDEVKNFEIRVDVIDILNTPWWNNPNLDINANNFGRTDANDVSNGLSNADNRSANRKFAFTARLNF